jgi:hypothetical protein
VLGFRGSWVESRLRMEDVRYRKEDCSVCADSGKLRSMRTISVHEPLESISLLLNNLVDDSYMRLALLLRLS